MIIKNSKLFAMLLIVGGIFLIISSLVSATGLIIPNIEQGGINTPVNISFLKTTTVTNPFLFYKPYYSNEWENMSLQVNTETVFGTIPGDTFWTEGVYNYYVSADNGVRYPNNGTGVFLITNKEITYRNWSEEFLKHDANGTSRDRHCSVHSGTIQGFTCFWSQMNTLEALRFAKGYKLTANQTYKTWSLNLTFSDYNNDSGSGLCDHAKNDYNCSSYSLGSGYTYGGAFRQGENIYFLTEVYKELKNESVLDLAKNYSLGVAGECDVWNNSFNCSSSLSDVSSAENQGAMLRGYLDLYSVTENETYKNITKQLFNEAVLFTDDSPLLMEAFGLYYETFGDTIAYAEMIKRAEKEQNVCVTNTCSPEKKAKQITAYLQVYKETGSEKYLQTLMKKLLRPATTCDALIQTYTCLDSMQQGLLNNAYTMVFNQLPATKKLFNSYKNQMLYVNQEVPINFSIEGYQTNLTFFYRQVDSTEWKNKTLNYWDWNVIIPANETSVEGIYEYYFQTNQKRYPEDQGVNLFVIPVSNEEYFEPLRGLEQNDSSLSCDPHGTNPNMENFNCQREHFQSWEGKSFLTTIATYNLSSTTNRFDLQTLAIKLGINRIDRDINNYQTESTCEFLDDDFVCETHAQDFSDEYLKPGGIRQATMIELFSNLYKETSNQTFQNRAYEYLISANDACDPFSGDFTCEIQPDSTINYEVNDYLANAYWIAYKTFGDNRWKKIAINLTKKIFTYSSDDYTEITGLALWHAYEQTGNLSYYNNATAVTDKLTDDCTSSYSCEAHKLAMNSLLMFEGLKQSKGLSSSYLNKALMNLRFISPANANQYCDPMKNSFSCKTPEDQGLMLMSYAKGVSEMIDLGNTTYTIGVFTNQTVPFKQNFTVTCQINNTNRVGSYEVSIISPFKIENASAVGGLVNPTLKKIKFSGLNENDTRNATWTLNADWGGKYQIQCVVESFQNSTNVTVNRLTDVVSQVFNESELYILQNEEKTIDLNITNIVKFDLETVRINLSTEYVGSDSTGNLSNSSNASISLDIINATIDDASATQTNKTIFDIPYIFTGTTEKINISLRGNDSGNFKLISELNTTYGGYDKKELNVFIYNSSFLKRTLLSADVLSINEPFKINLTINNTRNFTIENMTVRLIISDDFIKTQSPQNNNFTNSSNETYVNNSFNSLTKQELVWNYYPTKVGDYEAKIIINTTNPDYTYEINQSISVLGNVYNLSDSLTPSNTNFQEGDEYTLRLNISQNSAKNLTNVTAKIILPSGVSIININSDHTDLLNENWSLFSATNYSGNNVVTELNKTDNLSLVELISELNIIFNLSQHDENYSFTSARLKLLINGSINMTTNYLIFLQQNLTNATINDSICNFSISELNESTYYCNIPLANLTNQTNLTLKTDNTTIINSIFLETNSSYTFASGTKESATVLTYDVLQPNETVYSTWVFKLNTKDDKVIKINISSDQGAKTVYQKSFQGPVQETTESSGGGGGGGVPPLPEKKVNYNYSNYNYCNQIRPFNKLYTFTNFETECIFNDTSKLKNLTKNFLDCFNVERTFENHTTSLKITKKELDSSDLIGKEKCKLNFTKVFVYDIISKEIFNSTNDFEIKTKNEYVIIKTDPEIFFELKPLNYSNETGSILEPKQTEINYYNKDAKNLLTKYNRPIIFVRYDPPKLNKTTNETKEHSLLPETNATKKNETKKTNTKKKAITKFITISSEKFITTISQTYTKSKSKIKYYLIFIVLIVFVIYANKKGFFDNVRLEFPRKKQKQKIVLASKLEIFWIHFLIKINKLFAKKEHLFVLEANHQELDFIKDKDQHRLIIDLFFIFKELDFLKKKLETSTAERETHFKEMIQNMRLARLLLSKLLDLLSEKIDRKELEKLFEIIKQKLIEGKHFLKNKNFKQKSQLLILIKDVHYLMKLFDRKQTTILKKKSKHKFFWKSIEKLTRLKSTLNSKKEIPIKSSENNLKDKTIDFYINLKRLAQLKNNLGSLVGDELKKSKEEINSLKITLQKQKAELEELFNKTKNEPDAKGVLVKKRIKLTKAELDLKNSYENHLKRLYDRLV